MTPIEAMENVAARIRSVVKEYSTHQKRGTLPISVYAGYPPFSTKPEQRESYIYCYAVRVHDTEDSYSWVDIEIGFSICDEDPKEGCLSLYNLMEHVRQALLTKRTLGGRSSLLFPLEGEIVDPQPFPQWQGRLTVSYTIGQPTEGGIDYDGF